MARKKKKSKLMLIINVGCITIAFGAVLTNAFVLIMQSLEMHHGWWCWYEPSAAIRVFEFAVYAFVMVFLVRLIYRLCRAIANNW